MMRHDLVWLEVLIDWEFFEAEWAGFFPSHTGRPATSPRLVAGLLYLQHAYALSDEAVVARWAENPYWQHFCGETFFQHRPPIDPSSLTRWRQRIGEEGVEWLLTKTIEAGRDAGVIDARSTRDVSKRFRDNEVRLQLHALAYNMGSFLGRADLPEEIADWSLTSIQSRLLKIGARVVRHARKITFQLAEVAVSGALFGQIITALRNIKPPPRPA